MVEATQCVKDGYLAQYLPTNLLSYSFTHYVVLPYTYCTTKYDIKKNKGEKKEGRQLGKKEKKCNRIINEDLYQYLFFEMFLDRIALN